MQLEAKKYLYDISEAGRLIASFTQDKAFADYERDAMLRSAVERQFEIIGEALAQLARLEQGLAERISDHRRIIAFRNILIHGYPGGRPDRLGHRSLKPSYPAPAGGRTA